MVTVVWCCSWASSAILDPSWSITMFTCVPLLHRMPFTKPRAAKPRLGSKATATSARTSPSCVMFMSSKVSPSTMEA